MDKIKKYIKKIVENEEQEEMECLSEMLSELIYNSPEMEKYKRKLMGMALNYTFDEEYAKEIVDHMKPLGEYWDMETIKDVVDQYSLEDYNIEEIYIVMNSMVNDYNKIIEPENVDTYVKMTKAFINDEDAENNKVWMYFNTIPKK